MRHLAALLSLLLLLPAVAAAEELSATQIIDQSADKRTVENSVQTLTLTIFDKRGRSRTRTIESSVKQNDGLGMSYVRFVEPADVEGVQFLTIEREGSEDDQWLYMPAGAVLNRIAGSGKKGSFMGTDFSFEDLEIADSDDADHTRLPDETVTVGDADYAVYVIQSVPRPEAKSAYGKIVSYIDKGQLMPRQVMLFDAKGVAIKRMTIPTVKQDGETLVPTLTIMENLKKGSRTEVRVKEYRIDVPAEELPDSMFTPTYLQSEG